MDVVTIGEMMVMFVATEPGPLRQVDSYRKHVAGSEANVAIGLSRLGHRVGWISRLGDDDFGMYIRGFLRSEDVDVSRVLIDPAHPTGIAFKEKRELVPLKVIYYRRGSAASFLSPADLDPDYIVNARYLHFSGINPALSPSCLETMVAAAEIARAAGTIVSFDPNVRLRLWDADTCRRTLRGLLPLCDVVFPGLDEASLLTGETDPVQAGKAICALGPRITAVKLGAEGSLAVTADGIYRAPALHLAHIVDPVGAGDGFAAGFLSGQLRGLGVTESLRLGNVVGACAMSVPGDVEGFPTWSEVQSLEGSRDVAR